MISPFKPKGDRAEWRLIYDKLLAHADYGDVISYAELSEVLDRDFRENRGPMYDARDHLARTRRRWVEVVHGVGYRVIRADEHVVSAIARVVRAERQFGKGTTIIDGTDLSRLTPAGLADYDRVALQVHGFASRTASARRQMRRDMLVSAV